MASVRRADSSVAPPRAGLTSARRPLVEPNAAAGPVDPAAARGGPGRGEVLVLEAPPRAPQGLPGRRPVWRSPRKRLVAVGLLAVLIHIGVVATALVGLDEVARANAELGRITTAQRYFQDADMAHDAVLAAAGVALGESAGLLRDQDAPADLADETARFRRHLDVVDDVSLPSRLEDRLAAVRPYQVEYAVAADDLVRAFEAGAPPRAQMDAFRTRAQDLARRQEDVTQAMSDEADRRRVVAQEGRDAVQDRLGASAVVALLGLLGITGLLHRMGGDLATMVARERGVAETLQHSLLPDRLPELPGLRLAARYRASAVGTQVGGDWYDVVPLPGGRVGLVMGDVVGHDLHAASSMGQLRNALRACAAEGAPPDEVLERLNRLCVTQDLGEMATVLYAVLDPVSGEIAIANAGHYPPLLVTSTGRRFLEAAACPPVGVVREAQYTSSSCTLPAGSLLLLYTDGLVERRGGLVDEGLARLEQLVVAPPDGDLDALCDEVLAGMLGAEPVHDDVALLLVAPQAVLGAHVDVVWPAQAERLSLLRSMLERWLTEAGADDDEVYDILVACSEAATNAIEHAYGPARADFRVVCDHVDDTVTIVVRDWGQWREARGQDRGRGLGLMEELMDEVQVVHGDSGTEVRLVRRLQASASATVVPVGSA